MCTEESEGWRVSIAMTKHVPQADEKSASMGWFFDPGFIQNVQRVAADIENPSMETIDSVLFALREMGYIRVSGTCEHCVPAQDYAALLARHNALVEAVKWMLYIDTPENFEGGKHIKARAEVDQLLSGES